MRVLFAGFAGCALTACGPSAADVDLRLYVESPADDSCIGVAGFEVIIQSREGESRSGPLVATSPILDAGSCVITRPFTVSELEIDRDVTVQIRGYDGSGRVRVVAVHVIPKLTEGTIHVPLERSASQLPPILVIDRSPYLDGAAISDLTSVVVETQMMQPMTILSVNETTAGAYFDVEPGAFGTSLATDGRDDGTNLMANFVVSQTTQPKKQRFVARWNMVGRYYTAVPAQ